MDQGEGQQEVPLDTALEQRGRAEVRVPHKALPLEVHGVSWVLGSSQLDSDQGGDTPLVQVQLGRQGCTQGGTQGYMGPLVEEDLKYTLRF